MNDTPVNEIYEVVKLTRPNLYTRVRELKVTPNLELKIMEILYDEITN